MTSDLLKTRTEAFARRIVRLCLPMLEDPRYHHLARHLLRTGTAANANYGSALRGRSHEEFTARLGQACDDIAEARELLDVLSDVPFFTAAEEVGPLRKDAEELADLLACAYRAAERPAQHAANVDRWDRTAR